MSYAVLHIMKSSGSCNAIAMHIERSTQPSNAHPELRHLNRDDFIKYPEGVDSLGNAIRHRLDHAGLTRKIGKNQVLALNILLSSDGPALYKLAEEGRLNDWAETSIRWAIETFGKENVVAAHLHMDEQTPHLHVTVVPIVTTERKKKASEAKAKKRYRTKAKNGPRLSADDIMTRENLTRFQDTYAEAMERFGLERGIRGSEARHVDQHEYYRQCQIKKKDLEQDLSDLTAEKKKLTAANKRKQKEAEDLAVKKAFNEKLAADAENRYDRFDKYCADVQKTHKYLSDECLKLDARRCEMEKDNASLKHDNERMKEEYDFLQQVLDHTAERIHKADGDTIRNMKIVETFYPEVVEMLPAIRDCQDVGLSTQTTKTLMKKEELRFLSNATIRDPERNKDVDVGDQLVQIKRDPTDGNRFRLFIAGIRVLQWLRQQWQRLHTTFRPRLQSPQPTQKKSGIKR